MNVLPVVNPFLANPFLVSPLPWIVLAGLFVGAAASRATMRTARSRNPERARTRKWVFACVYLSVAVVLGLLAVFIPGSARIMDVRLAWAAAAAAVLAFAVMRFKKAAGIPVVVLLCAVVLVFGLFLQSIRAFTGETEIATVRVVGVESASMKLQLIPRGGEPVLLAMEGQYFAPIVKVVIFDDFFVFLGAKTWYRFEGMTSFNQSLRQGNSDYRFPGPRHERNHLVILREKRKPHSRREDRADRAGDEEGAGVRQLRHQGSKRRGRADRAEVRLSRGRGDSVSVGESRRTSF